MWAEPSVVHLRQLMRRAQQETEERENKVGPLTLFYAIAVLSV